MSRANPKVKPSAVAHHTDKPAPFAIGEDHAHEWLKDPRAQSLAMMRLGFQHEMVDIVQAMNEENPSLQISAETIIDGMALYNAGVDKVLEGFILLAMAEPEGGYQ